MFTSTQEALEQVFGFPSLREGQDEVIDTIMSGRDGVVIMPTGGGKSLCYQLPALCREGVTIVVSPLIALMKDQVDALKSKGVSAEMINSTVSWERQVEIMDRMRSGELKLVYVAPERFRVESFLQTIQRVKISLLAIDEAHCLSQWGHDFRPDYMRLGKARHLLGDPQCVAFTATATAKVRDDINQVLSLKDAFSVISGFSRPNLSFNINHLDKQLKKFQRMREIVAKYRTGIIYCSTRKKVEEVGELLHDLGVRVVTYHGGMSDQDRERTQNAFIKKEVDVAVATNAFGMGIDRSDLRFVIHYELPGSVEAYYQEAGRAGRDGEDAYCELFFNYADTRTQEFFIEGVNPSASLIRRVYQLLVNKSDGRGEVRLRIEDISNELDRANGMAVSSAISYLLKSQVIERFDVEGQRVKGTRILNTSLLARDLPIKEAALEEKERRDREKLKSMVSLCYDDRCRQEWILHYFGEDESTPCLQCDQCVSGESSEQREPSEEEHLLVRKVLSGVARMSHQTTEGWKPRFGKGKMVQALTGSQSQEMFKFGLQNLSTYGILKGEKVTYLNAVLGALERASLVRTEVGDYPLLTLTESGEKAMKGNSQYRLVWPSRQQASISSIQHVLSDCGFDSQVYDSLCRVRDRLAKEEKVPPYRIFSNKTLEELARYRPTSKEEALHVNGVGPQKADSYVAAFLEELRRFS